MHHLDQCRITERSIDFKVTVHDDFFFLCITPCDVSSLSTRVRFQYIVPTCKEPQPKISNKRHQSRTSSNTIDQCSSLTLVTHNVPVKKGIECGRRLVVDSALAKH